ncbi:E3 ubiquitin-protein ligase NRDP1-like [Oppia nitens]|uniref:E3 ubiquitin-protein ligase NRDP1-like n=1 Tax=Oppia nitens TaxID=1686743 RepID=UPI0023DC4FB7|nr:E3 ubiquitin-protein ligase NRDP1-like [Oppia nitens]
MPGYDKQRFVDIKSDDLIEFTCGICMDIFDDPVFSTCCRQTYCRTCISEWLSTQKSCPNDRKSLTLSDLSTPPRILINLINKLKIKCDFYENGCQDVCPLSQLSEHRTTCLWNPNRKCTDCDLIVGTNVHNCIENLKIRIKSLNNEIKAIKRENRELKTETDRSKRNQNTGNNQSSVSRDDKTIRIVNSRMNESMKEYALSVANEAHDRFRNEPEGRLSTFVRNEFEKKYKSLWNCLVSSSINWGTSIHHFENHYIYFKIGLFHFMIWESSK